MSKTTESKKTVIKSLLGKITELSQGTLKNSHASPTKPYDLLSWVRQDVILRAALEIKHSTMTKIGYHFISGLSSTEKNILKQVRFDKYLSQIYWQMAIYRNAFTELNTTSSGKVVGLSVIKTDEMEIVNKPNGEVVGYLQFPTNPDSKQKLISFPKDKIVHFSTNLITTSLWGDSELITVLPILQKKKLIEDFINWLFESNQFRTVIKIPSGVNENDISVYVDMLKEGMINPTNFLTLQGDTAEVGMLRKIEGFGELLNILDYYRSQILSILQLPPLQVGILESSNRSSSEYQVRYAFYTHIIGQFKALEDELNYELLPKLGIKKQIKFDLADDKTKTDLLDMAQKLANMGANPEKLNKWLIDQGLDIPEDLLEAFKDDINDDNDSLNNVKDNKNLKLDKNSDLHPSRNKSEMDFSGGSRKK